MVASRLGGSAACEDDLLAAWQVASSEAKARAANSGLGTSSCTASGGVRRPSWLLRLGDLQVGLSRHRALLFKVSLLDGWWLVNVVPPPPNERAILHCHLRRAAAVVAAAARQ